jgi:hypothetical protein
MQPFTGIDLHYTNVQLLGDVQGGGASLSTLAKLKIANEPIITF